MSERSCPLCGRPVLCLGLTTCDACASRTVVAPSAPPVATKRWTCLSEPVPCRECHRMFVRTKGAQKRCPDCCRDGVGGNMYRDGKRVRKRDMESWDPAAVRQ